MPQDRPIFLSYGLFILRCPNSAEAADAYAYSRIPALGGEAHAIENRILTTLRSGAL